MQQLKTFIEKLRENARYIIGGIILFFGAIFMFVPFIPLGYIFIGIGAFLLSPAIPALKRLLNYIEKKDKSNKISKLEKKTDQFIHEKFEKKS